MPEYKYRAQDQNGKIVKGRSEAADESALHKRFHDEGLTLLDATPVVKRVALRPLKKAQLADFARQLGTLTKAGVSLVKSLEIIAHDESIDSYQRDIFLKLRDRIVQGVALSNVMDELEPAFPPLFIFMIRASETTGNLDDAAMRLAEHYTDENELEQQVKSSLTYPKILSVLIVIVVAILFGYVLPQFEEIFADMPKLPLPTVILMAISDFVATKWYIILIVAALLVIFGKIFLRLPAIKYQLDKIKTKSKWGKLTKVIYSARFARTLSSLYAGGIAIYNCIDIAKSTIGNAYIEAQFDEVLKKIAGGSSISDSIKNIDGFVVKLPASIKIGEETGQLSTMLESVANDLDFYSRQAIKKLTAYIEPVMIVIMAVIVGFVIIAVIQPIYNSYSTIGSGV
ncbi:MAG: type II secretion system F family protein [Saccharofermentans sp.]|nr:type II secretion system F family protein [Saccharofermentans sp.]